jgi:hypothetical protein
MPKPIGHRNYQEYAKPIGGAWDPAAYFCDEHGYVKDRQCPECGETCKKVYSPDYHELPCFWESVPFVTLRVDGAEYSGYLHTIIYQDRIFGEGGDVMLHPSDYDLIDEMKAALANWEARCADVDPKRPPIPEE